MEVRQMGADFVVREVCAFCKGGFPQRTIFRSDTEFPAVHIPAESWLSDTMGECWASRHRYDGWKVQMLLSPS
jgi:hypothetical protein